MPSRAEIVSFDDSPATARIRSMGAWRRPGHCIDVTDRDPAWPRRYDELAGRIREALGWRALQLEHVGSTSVPGLAAKKVAVLDSSLGERTDAGPERGVLLVYAGRTADAMPAEAGEWTSPEIPSDSPYALAGDTDQMADPLVERRERWGLTYFTCWEEDNDVLAPGGGAARRDLAEQPKRYRIGWLSFWVRGAPVDRWADNFIQWPLCQRD